MISRAVGGSIATGSVSKAGQGKSDVPDKERHPGPPGWVLGNGLTFHSHKTQHCEENSTLKYITGWDT